MHHLTGVTGLLSEGHARSYHACGGGRILVQYSAAGHEVFKARLGYIGNDPLAP